MYITSASNCPPPPINVQLDSEQQKTKINSHPLQNSSHMMSYGMEYSFGQFKSVMSILFPARNLVPSLRMALALYNAANQQQKTLMYYQHCFSLKAKRSIKPGTLKRTIPSQLKLRHSALQTSYGDSQTI